MNNKLLKSLGVLLAFIGGAGALLAVGFTLYTAFYVPTAFQLSGTSDNFELTAVESGYGLSAVFVGLFPIIIFLIVLGIGFVFMKVSNSGDKI
ncbi:hypothetical protein L2725_10110 [Shewanella corallii]|uniref:Uncharacterized protein n=1 Tax=Shewanella corallii TaxID=560080 RepID=A0ABT0N6P4_9GAMM|nr:hypothetical protein [Shewanella corallii]MCL2914124.1 hypothetical protein [Shewanella corallii]